MNSKLRNAEDKTLWDALRRGDERALHEIYHRYYSVLYNYGFKIHPDDAFVKDAIQEVFINIINKHKQLGQTDNIRFYLFRSLRNKIYRTLQQQSRQQNNNKDLKNSSDEMDFSIEEQIVSNEQEEERQNEIFRLLKFLSSRQQEAIYLKYYQEFDNKKIAEVMDISYQSVRTLIYKAIKEMRKQHVKI